jgi:hypothetical protein
MEPESDACIAFFLSLASAITQTHHGVSDALKQRACALISRSLKIKSVRLPLIRRGVVSLWVRFLRR